MSGKSGQVMHTQEVFKLIDPTRFWSKVEKTDGCWNWIGTTSPDGYGSIGKWINERKHSIQIRAHRLSLYLSGVEVPTYLVVDHICRNRKCVNPKHLRAVSWKINALENSHSVSAKHKIKTHCNKGHEFNDQNTAHRRKRGGVARICLICARAHQAVADKKRRVKKT